MPDDDPGPIEWFERDTRDWIPLAHTPDQVSARMTVTYLEASGFEARVGSEGGQFTVEVPYEQYEDALNHYQPMDSSVSPPMQEATSKTGVHTGRHIRERIAAREEEQLPERPRRGGIVLKLLLLLALAALVLIVLAL